VVLRARGRVPRVEMAGDDDDLVRQVATGDLGDDVVYFNVVADAVLVRELDSDWAVLEHALDELHVFEADLRGGAVEEAAVAGERGGGFAAVGAADQQDGLRRELVEVVEPLEDLAERGILAERVSVDEDEAAGERILLRVDALDGEMLQV